MSGAIWSARLKAPVWSCGQPVCANLFRTASRPRDAVLNRGAQAAVVPDWHDEHINYEWFGQLFSVFGQHLHNRPESLSPQPQARSALVERLHQCGVGLAESQPRAEQLIVCQGDGYSIFQCAFEQIDQVSQAFWGLLGQIDAASQHSQGEGHFGALIEPVTAQEAVPQTLDSPAEPAQPVRLHGLLGPVQATLRRLGLPLAGVHPRHLAERFDEFGRHSSAPLDGRHGHAVEVQGLQGVPLGNCQVCAGAQHSNFQDRVGKPVGLPVGLSEVFLGQVVLPQGNLDLRQAQLTEGDVPAQPVILSLSQIPLVRPQALLEAQLFAEQPGQLAAHQEDAVLVPERQAQFQVLLEVFLGPGQLSQAAGTCVRGCRG